MDITYVPEIDERLDAIEAKYDVDILYACESGSRAWGFESRDSDYDIRFVYVKRNVLDYLSVDPVRDVIEETKEPLYDMCGWEFGKALRLGRACNSSLFEWFHSPIVYREETERIQPFRDVMPLLFQPLKLYRCYLGMAKNNYREYLHGETVWMKKYLYVLRPLLACEWVRRFGTGKFPPVQFDSLWRGIVPADSPLSLEIETLLRMKLAGLEKEMGPRFPAIDAFIDGVLAADEPAFPALEPVDTEMLNRIYRDTFNDDFIVGSLQSSVSD